MILNKVGRYQNIFALLVDQVAAILVQPVPNHLPTYTYTCPSYCILGTLTFTDLDLNGPPCRVQLRYPLMGQETL